jgi:hypothetical protein
MATSAEMTALLAVPCPYCGAPRGTKCGRTVGKFVTHPTTLDGESHDARWQRAGLGGATVLSERVAERRAPALVASAVVERPW